MKKLILLLSIFVSLQLSAQQWSFHDLVGTWKAESGAGLAVKDSSEIYLLFNDQQKKAYEIKLNLSSNPATLDFTVLDTSGKTALQSLFQFINKDLIQWQVFEGKRTVNFTASAGEIIYLRRKQ